MWDPQSVWFDLFLFSFLLLVGQVLFGHFEERTPVWRKLVKTLALVGIYLGLVVFCGRFVAWGAVGLMFLPVVVVHGFVLPRKGIHGLTAEPREKYYALRGWDTDIFHKRDNSDDSPK